MVSMQDSFKDEFYGLTATSASNVTALNTNNSCRYFNTTNHIYSGGDAYIIINHTASGAAVDYDNISLTAGGTTTAIGDLDTDTQTTITFDADLLRASNCFYANFDPTYSTNISEIELYYNVATYSDYAGVYNDTAANAQTSFSLNSLAPILLAAGGLLGLLYFTTRQ